MIYVEDLNTDLIKTIISTFLELLCKQNDDFKDFKVYLDRNGNRDATEKLFLNAKGHNCTEPMLDVLESYGFECEITPIRPTGDTSQHIEAMVELGNVIKGIIPKQIQISPDRKNDVIVYCPSIYTYLYRVKSVPWQRINRKLDNRQRKFLRSVLIRNRGYGNSTISINENDVFNPYEDPLLGQLLRDRQTELKIFTAAISLVAVNQFIPAFRFPNSVMLHHDRLRDIGGLLTSNDREWREKLNGKMREYCHVIRQNIGESLFESSFGKMGKILSVCDFPIEWIPIEHLPAMFKYELSRVPATPGNVILDILTSRPKISARYHDLCNILIIRSFKDDDPIKDHLCDAIRVYKESNSLPGLDIKIINVKTRKEVIEALSAFSGLMVIFDCHGGHGGETDSAWLKIGDEKLNVWHFYKETRVPPIVVLAACSTHPAEGSHASVANGFLESGAYSVIGTFAPVESIHTAVFVSRLLARVAVYLPLVLENRTCSWRELVSGLLKMSYVRDVLVVLRDTLCLIEQKQFEEIHVEANMLINTYLDENWFEKFRSMISKEAGLNDEEMTRIWEENFHFVDSMLFVQLGRPENIVFKIDS